MKYITVLARALLNSLHRNRFRLVLVFLILLSFNTINADIAVAAQPCLNSWSIALQGLKSTYTQGEGISATATYAIRNDVLAPGNIQQILVGIIDTNGTVYGIARVYNGTPKACPQETTGIASISLNAPTIPGTYQIIASNYYQMSYEDAERLFPRNPSSSKPQLTLQVVDSGTPTAPSKPSNSGSASTATPSAMPNWLQQFINPSSSSPNTTAATSPMNTTAKPGQMPDFVSWFQRNLQAIFTILAPIIIIVVGLLYLVKKQHNMMDRVVSISIGGAAALFLLWVYVFVPIINFLIQHWLAILISAAILLVILVFAWIKGWIRIGRPTTTTTPPPSQPQQLVNEGWVYVMRYPYHTPDLYKIGKTGTHPDQRLVELSRETGSPTPPVLVNDWKVPDRHRAESTIHQALDQYRVNPKREFFQVSYKVIQATIDKIVADMERDDTLS